MANKRKSKGRYKTPLTDREMKILCLLSFPDIDIANRLFVSLRSIRQSKGIIFRKLNVKTRNEAMIKAIRQGIIDVWDITLSTDEF